MISQSLEKTLSKLIEIFRNQNIPFLLMGGIAASVYSISRATFDIDGLVVIRKEKLSPFLAQARKAGFIYDTKNPLKVIGNFSFLTLYSKSSKIYVDLFLAEGIFHEQIVQRAKKIKLSSRTVHVISPEDLILLKLQTGRERDLEDIRNIISENKEAIDFEYLKKWARYLGVEVYLKDELRSLRTKDHQNETPFRMRDKKVRRLD